jgi:hypothetical protein
MRGARILQSIAVLVALMNWSTAPLYGGDSAMNPEDLVARHLDAIGSKEARAAAKTRVVQGAAVYRILVGGGGVAEGKTGLVSDGRKLRFMMKFQTDYRGETFVGNGEAVHVAFSNSNQSRSPLASFITTYDVIVRDGLLGGVLSTGWALSDVADRKAKLVYEGVKKVEGRPVHQLRYEPNKHTDAQIRLYFDAETFRHVKTVYSTSVGSNVGSTIIESVNVRAERSSLEERFSDFKTVDGLTLPTHWNLQFTRELPNGSTTLSEWDLKEDQITNNMGLDPRNFELK